MAKKRTLILLASLLLMFCSGCSKDENENLIKEIEDTVFIPRYTGPLIFVDGVNLNTLSEFVYTDYIVIDREIMHDFGDGTTRFLLVETYYSPVENNQVSIFKDTIYYSDNFSDIKNSHKSCEQVSKIKEEGYYLIDSTIRIHTEDRIIHTNLDINIVIK